MKPKLRQIEARVIQRGDQTGILLRDPLRLSDRAIFLPRSLAPVLELCDGTRDPSELRASLAVRAGVQLGPATLERLLIQLDEALLLDNQRFAEAHAAALQQFRTAAFRPSILAGEGYPADGEELRETLRGYFDAVQQGQQQEEAPTDEIRGLVSPHIDFERGGTVYAQAWGQAAEAVREADLAIVFGTDHIGGEAKLTFTHQRYATPWGPLPTANEIVDAIARRVGPGLAFRDELHHRSEHSIELTLVWLQYLLAEDSRCELLPVLCGSFEAFLTGEADPAQDDELSGALDLLREAMVSRNCIVVAAGDLAHVGPAFGDPYPIDFFQRARLRSADEELMASICAGDENAFLEIVKAEGDRRRICGLPPIYLALRLLGDTTGRVTGYAQCAADQAGVSFVSICGVLFW